MFLVFLHTISGVFPLPFNLVILSMPRFLNKACSCSPAGALAFDYFKQGRFWCPAESETCCNTIEPRQSPIDIVTGDAVSV